MHPHNRAVILLLAFLIAIQLEASPDDSTTSATPDSPHARVDIGLRISALSFDTRRVNEQLGDKGFASVGAWKTCVPSVEFGLSKWNFRAAISIPWQFLPLPGEDDYALRTVDGIRRQSRVRYTSYIAYTLNYQLALWNKGLFAQVGVEGWLNKAELNVVDGVLSSSRRTEMSAGPQVSLVYCPRWLNTSSSLNPDNSFIRLTLGYAAGSLSSDLKWHYSDPNIPSIPWLQSDDLVMKGLNVGLNVGVAL